METRTIEVLAEQMHGDLLNKLVNRNTSRRLLMMETLKSDEDFRERMVERFNQYVTLRQMIVDVEDAKSPVDEDRFEDGGLYQSSTGALMEALEDIKLIEFDFDQFLHVKINQELDSKGHGYTVLDPDEATIILGKLYDGDRYESVQKYLNEKYDLDG